ncbi:SDR family oxidoreductase [Granulicella paludicola]|uniref:SDR family oxidoreductase n=1 Tax=Granulicella paludicola TaxID=474951 RepID=UPI0021E05F80|nr:SDR family oxidoreductase [Granulicella paludicola]
MRTVLITGASSGIGEATAEYFFEKGWRVCATARSPEKLGAWSTRNEVIRLPLDVANHDSVQFAIAEALRLAGKIDVVVNNAGVGLAGPLEAIPMEDFEAHFQTNVFGAVRVIQSIMPSFREQRGGVIVNVSSVVGTFGVPFISPYCAGKFAIEGLSESLYYELLPFNIRIKLVEPGGIKTNFRQDFAQHKAYQPNLGAAEAVFQESAGPTSSLPSPRGVAEAIFKAATDGTQRLRYPVKTQGASVLYRLLPESLWRATIAKSFGIGGKR